MQSDRLDGQVGTMSKEIESIAARILAVEAGRPVRVAIDGFCAAGKTTLADAVAQELAGSGRPVIRVCADKFQSPPEKRWQLGRHSPEGFYRHAIDVEAIRDQLLEPLNGPDQFSYRSSTYDIRNMKPNRSPMHAAAPDSLVIVDGLFLFMPMLMPYWDLTVFVDTPFNTCIERARLRNQEGFKDADSVEKRYRERYWPGYQLYLEEFDPKSLVDAVVDGGRGCNSG